MRAEVGDRIVIRSHRIGESIRDAEVLATGPDGEPPFQVRWGDTGHEALFFPGSDAFVEHVEHSEHSRVATTTDDAEPQHIGPP